MAKKYKIFRFDENIKKIFDGDLLCLLKSLSLEDDIKIYISFKMADVREQRIYCAEQIVVPEELPNILKHYSKAVIKENPANIISFSAKYFRNLLDQQNNKAKDHIEKPDSHHWSVDLYSHLLDLIPVAHRNYYP